MNPSSASRRHRRSAPWLRLGHVFVAMVFIATAAAQEQVTLPLALRDSLDFVWNVNKDGSIVQGIANVFYTDRRNGYLGGVGLYVGGARFGDVESGTRFVRETGIEVVIGPHPVAGVTVTRKVFAGYDEGHIQYLDIIENRSTSPVTVDVQLRSEASGAYVPVWESPNALVVAYGNGVLTHVHTGPGAQHAADVRVEGRLYTATWTSVSIQPQSRVVFTHFVAQRGGREEALQLAQVFDVAAATVWAAASDLASIVNFDPATLGARTGFSILRGDENDVIRLKSGDRLTGTILNESIRIQTSYALLEFPTEEIATLVFEGGANNIERVVVLNGDVFSGFIIDPIINFRLAAGPSVNIRKEKIGQAGFRIRPTELDEYPVQHEVVLTNGDRFSGRVLNDELTIEAAFGALTVDLPSIARIVFVSERGVVTEVTLNNGDKVSGFLRDEDIIIDLDFGAQVAVFQDRVERIIFDRAILEGILERERREAEGR